MAFQPPAVPTAPNTPEDSEAALAQPMCVMSFNACDPSGAGGLTADITTIASQGTAITEAHARRTLAGCRSGNRNKARSLVFMSSRFLDGRAASESPSAFVHLLSWMASPDGPH